LLAVSKSMDKDVRIEAPAAAMAHHGLPVIFDTDQGRLFTSPRFTGVLAAAGLQGPGRVRESGENGSRGSAPGFA
jgi:hypothetical protein